MIAVIFEVKVEQGKMSRYLSLATDLKPLLQDIKGFISIERFQSLSTQGKLLSLSWWENEEAVLQWKKNILHKNAQQEGRSSLFNFYRISIVSMTREYSFNKENP
ncbi:antibiotic biosynthesis monooxygenase family protein [Proteus appendicitidis]|uniref:Antibiotic biosynthesis monooxygenase n=1 Tax=Proteus appendicitidis TaxID=3034648 RepID=A0ABY8YD77_9GAMM|nr:antibiotic biosynthesis monooxygenase [Proteus sp. HZ0627]MBG3131178.1 antibiotic biosynthesis monooxygenase [Proteus mirabilis]WIV90099.1 antibiotic biosynthesis monooxygenase [Proteus sp. HZ0627]